MTNTQHSTLKTQRIWMGESWVWSVNPECRVLSIHHKLWVQALNLWRFISPLHFKLQHQIHVFEWGILKCGRIHILRSGIPNQIHGVLSVECWVSVISLGPGQAKCKWDSSPTMYDFPSQCKSKGSPGHGQTGEGNSGEGLVRLSVNRVLLTKQNTSVRRSTLLKWIDRSFIYCNRIWTLMDINSVR